ncbi:MAG: hypothetical protein A2076_14450 [Geobacteraceae bacterium GWC2_53_11]|nr:MAG: hypothetical protein A2076_14450 [Geobacteraceae bacterium GWC2_53_11]
MEVTWIGLIILPLGLLLAFLSPRWLYYLTVFSIPFSATALLNSGSESSKFAVQYLGMLWMIRYWITRGMRLIQIPTLRINKESFAPFWLWFFGVVVTASMIMPYLIRGKDSVIFGEPSYSSVWVPIELTWETAKYPVPVLFGILFATTIAMENANAMKLRNTLRVYVLSGVFLAAWGMVQFLCSNVLHLPYPSFVFNTSELTTTQGYLQMTESGINRIASASREPSMFAKQLLVILPLLLYGLFTRTRLFSRSLDLYFLVFMAVMILLSTASSGYIGLPIVFGLSVAVLMFSGNKLLAFRIICIISLVIVVGFLCAYMLMPETINSILSETLFNKQESGSMFVRLASLAYAWPYFEKYPIIGAGWNFVTSYDLIVCLLANVGIVGLSAFTIFAIQPIIRTMKLLKNIPSDILLNSNPVITYAIGTAISQVLLLVLAIIGGYEFYLVYSYMTIGLLYAANSQLHLINVATRIKN